MLISSTYKVLLQNHKYNTTGNPKYAQWDCYRLDLFRPFCRLDAGTEN